MNRMLASPIITSVLLWLGGFPFTLPSAIADNSYFTTPPWEADSLLAAWVIKRHVDPSAHFLFLVKGQESESAFSIDTPGGHYSRTAQYTAFEQVVTRHQLNFSCMKRLIHFSRVLEMAAWRKGQYPDAVKFEKEIYEQLNSDDQQMTDEVFSVVDRWCDQKLAIHENK